MEEIWQQVSSELVFGHPNVESSNKGQVRVNGVLVKPHKGAKGKNGVYKICTINGKTVYFHRLVYFAFAKENVNVLLHSRIIFKSFHEGMVDDKGFYRAYLEDITIEHCKNADINTLIPSSSQEVRHQVYGVYSTGKWYDVQGHLFLKGEKKHMWFDFPDYELCVLENAEYPCIVRHKQRKHKWLKPSNEHQDPMISMCLNKKAYKFMLSHVMLSSVFGRDFINETVDHMDDDSTNNNINNLQWMSLSDNAKKGRMKQLNGQTDEKMEGAVQFEINEDDEIWRTLNKTTEISNYARIKRNGRKITYGHVLRGKKYRQATVKVEIEGLQAESKKYFIHQLVWMAFNGKIPDGKIILHDDKAPLVNGIYRNWLCDLRLGTRSENNIEHHDAKREKSEFTEVR